MHEINLIDKSFSPDAVENYSLMVQINTSGLAYCIYDRIAKYYSMFRKHRFEQVILQDDLIRNIETILEKDDTLSLPFHEVSVMAYTRQSTLVPDEYFDPGDLKKYLDFNHGSETDHSIFSNRINTIGIHNIFALPDELVSLMMLHFQKARFLNQSTPFIWHITGQPEALTKKAVYIGLNSDFFDIACTGEKKLLLYNTFQFVGENDLLYYILFVYQKLGFDIQNIPLYVSGELSTKLSYWDTLRQYLDTRYDEMNLSSSMSPALKSLAASKFLNLLNVRSCVSSAENSVVAE